MEIDNYESNLTLILVEKTEIKIRYEENRRAGSGLVQNLGEP